MSLNNGHGQSENGTVLNTREKMARLTGAPLPEDDKGFRPLATDELLNGVEEEEDAQGQGQGKKPASSAKDPFVKGGVVGAITLVAVGAVVLVFNGFSVQPPTRKPVSQAQAALPVEEDSQSKEAKLLTDLALGRQSREIELQRDQVGSSAASPRPTAAVLPPAQLKPPVPALPPSPPRPATITPLPPPPATSALPPSIAVNPEEYRQRWQTLATLGSAGQVSAPGTAGRSQSGSASPVLDARLSQNQATPVDYRSEQAVLEGRVSNTSLRVLTHADAMLQDPVVFEGDNRDSIKDDTYSVLLVSPLMAADNKTVVVQAGREVVAKVQAISSTGLVRLYVTSVLDQERGEIPVPGQSLVLRGVGRGPVLARNIRDRGSDIGSMDMGLAALAGLAKAAELYNRPQTTSTVSSLGSFSSTSTTPPPNIPAGVIQGATDILVQQISQRNQRAIQESLNRPNLWLVPAGTRLEVYVNQSIPQL